MRTKTHDEIELKRKRQSRRKDAENRLREAHAEKGLKIPEGKQKELF